MYYSFKYEFELLLNFDAISLGFEDLLLYISLTSGTLDDVNITYYCLTRISCFSLKNSSVVIGRTVLGLIAQIK